MNPQLPDGTSTQNLPCRFCGHPRIDHGGDYGGTCFGSLSDTPESFELDPAALGNMQKGPSSQVQRNECKWNNRFKFRVCYTPLNIVPCTTSSTHCGPLQTGAARGVNKPMKVYGGRIYMARNCVRLSRKALADAVGVRPFQIREWEKRRTNPFKESQFFGECVPIDVPDSAIDSISKATGFRPPFFQDYNDQESFQPISWACENPDTSVCICGKRGTRLCDAVIAKEEPVYSDAFNKIIVDHETKTETCDNPICDDCTERKVDHDLCHVHCSRKHYAALFGVYY